jgi:hypothetical protein
MRNLRRLTSSETELLNKKVIPTSKGISTKGGSLPWLGTCAETIGNLPLQIQQLPSHV